MTQALNWLNNRDNCYGHFLLDGIYKVGVLANSYQEMLYNVSKTWKTYWDFWPTFTIFFIFFQKLNLVLHWIWIVKQFVDNCYGIMIILLPYILRSGILSYRDKFSLLRFSWKISLIVVKLGISPPMLPQHNCRSWSVSNLSSLPSFLTSIYPSLSMMCCAILMISFGDKEPYLRWWMVAQPSDGFLDEVFPFFLNHM